MKFGIYPIYMALILQFSFISTLLNNETILIRILLCFSLIFSCLLLVNTSYCHYHQDEIQILHLALNPNLGKEYEYSDDLMFEHNETLTFSSRLISSIVISCFSKPRKDKKVSEAENNETILVE
ncbi:18098_t:CDS:2 [Funneliformis geosporum]|uniref:6787_t:CDS:1 n=1 Tax=Funneliformis geosporum TaxID=1117311 RepID=A0A9W4SC90_9GLOM|nr:18098_t:CDS:2 [Funneliformis geosporum]CAI2163333.1 6787_t:CDS:2 [Funneliformis geosporum]